jgi:uncharacterized repeat protein (TIGR01451 family)
MDDEYNSALSGSVLIVVVPVKPLSKADLAITKMCTPNPVPVGGLMNYLITVTNRGPSSASDVVVEDFLPPGMEFRPPAKASQGSYDEATGLWSVGGLTKYRSAKLVLTMKVPSEVGPGQIANTAYVYGAEVDPDNSNNLATTYTRVRAANSSPE